MKKLVSLIVAIFIAGLFITDFSLAEVNNSTVAKPIYQPFDIYFEPDERIPDPLRDNLPWAKYDPLEGLTLYKVETYDGESPSYGSLDRCRVALDNNNTPIKLELSETNYTNEIRRCINVLNPNSYITGDIIQEYVSLKMFYEPINIYEGELCGTGRSFPVGETSIDVSIAYMTSKPGHNTKPGDIMFLDSSLQYEKWSINNGKLKLDERLAWNPDTRPDLSVYFFGSFNFVARYTSLRKGFLELLPNVHKLIYRGEESAFHRWKYDLCEMHDGHVAMGLYTLGELIGCNVHSWNYETRKSYDDKAHIDYYHVNLMDEDDSFRRLTFEFDNDTAILHRSAYDDKEIALPFAPYISEDAINVYYKPLEMRVPVLKLLDILGYNYYYREINNSVLIDLHHNW